MCRPLRPVGRATNCFTIDRLPPRQRGCRHNLTHPATKEGFDLLWIKRAKQPVEGRRRRRAIFQHQEPLEPRLTSPRQQGKVLAGIHVAQIGADGDHQQSPEVVERPVALGSWIVNFIEETHQTEASMAHFVRPKDESRPNASEVYIADGYVA